jgi:hypothetical protein
MSGERNVPGPREVIVERLGGPAARRRYRGLLLLVTLACAVRTGRGSRAAFVLVRVSALTMLAAVIVVVSIPGYLPSWVTVEQIGCGALLAGVVLIGFGAGHAAGLRRRYRIIRPTSLRAGFRGKGSSRRAAAARESRMGMCWGQRDSHTPHFTQLEA